MWRDRIRWWEYDILLRAPPLASTNALGNFLWTMGKALHVCTFIGVCVYMMTMGRCVEYRWRRANARPFLVRLELGSC
jgi:hypothetical protein